MNISTLLINNNTIHYTTSTGAFSNEFNFDKDLPGVSRTVSKHELPDEMYWVLSQCGNVLTRQPQAGRLPPGPGERGQRGYLLVLKEGSEQVLSLVSWHGFVAGIAGKRGLDSRPAGSRRHPLLLQKGPAPTPPPRPIFSTRRALATSLKRWRIRIYQWSMI
jgi:hypothetical protein